MATAHYVIREGVTDPLVFDLLNLDIDTEDGSAVDITGYTSVVGYLRSYDEGDLITFTEGSNLTVNATNPGQVQFDLTGSELSASEKFYEGYIRITDAAGLILDFPSDGSFQIEVLEKFA